MHQLAVRSLDKSGLDGAEWNGILRTGLLHLCCIDLGDEKG